MADTVTDDEQALDLLTVAADLLCEFLEAAFHLILYIREVYPADIFERRKKYNVPVQMSCHPELNQYILDVLQSVKPLLEKGTVERIVLTISDKDYHCLERFVFELKEPDISCLKKDSYLVHTEEALRAFLLKINVCDALLAANPKVFYCPFQCTYNKDQIEERFPVSLQEFPWLHADTAIVTMESPTIIPLKSSTSGLLKMQLFVEQSTRKVTRTQS